MDFFFSLFLLSSHNLHLIFFAFVISIATQVVENNDNESKAVHTFHKGQRFSRKLKRRLTLRTVAEARALKKQSKETLHILLYAAELVSQMHFSLEIHCFQEGFFLCL